jgi:hypothetical protein
MNINMLLGRIGMTKKQAIDAVLGLLVRRFYIQGFDQAESYEAPSSELRRVLTDKNYRRDLYQAGKVARNLDLFDLDPLEIFSEVLGDKSVTLMSLIEGHQENGSFEVTDEIVDLAMGEVLSHLTWDEQNRPFEESDLVTPDTIPVLASLKMVFAASGQQIRVSEIYPDIHQYLSVDGEKVEADLDLLSVSGGISSVA